MREAGLDVGEDANLVVPMIHATNPSMLSGTSELDSQGAS